MKIMHTSDWHIGKIINEFSMIEDQKYVLERLIELIAREKPHVLIIAGDIYDRSIPPVEAVEVLNQALDRLVNEQKVKVLAISGNHDSGCRLGFGSTILRKQGLFLVGDEQKLYEKIVLKEDGQEVHFYLVPYKDPAVIRRLIEDKQIKNHEEGMAAILESIEKERDESVTNILVGHGYVAMKKESEDSQAQNDTDAEVNDTLKVYKNAKLDVSESERPLAVGGTDLIDGSIFKDFDYVALGHLHGRQRVGRDTMRYSGSLLQYSFSEEKHIKGVTSIQVTAPKQMTTQDIKLEPRRRFRIVENTLQHIIENGREEEERREDYIYAVLTDEGELMNPIEQLRAVYPHVMGIARKNEKVIDESQTAAKSGYKSKSEITLFEEFYEVLGQGTYTDAKKDILKDVIDTILRKEVE